MFIPSSSTRLFVWQSLLAHLRDYLFDKVSFVYLQSYLFDGSLSFVYKVIHRWSLLVYLRGYCSTKSFRLSTRLFVRRSLFFYLRGYSFDEVSSYSNYWKSTDFIQQIVYNNLRMSLFIQHTFIFTPHTLWFSLFSLFTLFLLYACAYLLMFVSQFLHDKEWYQFLFQKNNFNNWKELFSSW